MRLRHTAWALLFMAAACFDFGSLDPRENPPTGDGGTSADGGGGATTDGGGGTTGQQGGGGTGGDGGTMPCTPGEQVICYDGPVGTDQNLPCQPGLQMCGPDGMPEGACAGQVLPGLEICSSAVDENCDSDPADHCSLWSAMHGGTTNQSPQAVAVDGNDNIIIAAASEDTADFGGNMLSSLGLTDVVVAKYNAAGVHQWSDIWGGAGEDLARGMVVDGSGNIYIAGHFENGLDFGVVPTLSSAGGWDIFVVMIDAAGNPQWNIQLGGTDDDYANDIAIDGAGNLVIGAMFRSNNVNFGDGAVSPTGTQDVMIIKRNTAGGHIASYQFGGTGFQYLRRVETLGTDIYFTGEFTSGNISFGGPTLTPDSGSWDTFVATINASGGHVGTLHIDGAGDTDDPSIAVAAGGDVILCGAYEGELDLGDGTVTAVDVEDAYIARYNSAGVLQWKTVWPAVEDQDCETVNIAPNGDLIISISLEGTVDYGGGPHTSAGSDDGLLLRLTSTGTYVRSRQFGDSSDQDPDAVAINGLGQVVMLAECNGTVDFGSGPEATNGADDICLALMDF